jgi:hypothetical protein
VTPSALVRVRREWPLAASLATTVVFLTLGERWLADLGSLPWFGLMLGWLFGATVMYAGRGESSLARDTMLAIVMLVLNGLVGACLLLGGLRYHEQTYNIYCANAFLACWRSPWWSAS